MEHRLVHGGDVEGGVVRVEVADGARSIGKDGRMSFSADEICEVVVTADDADWLVAFTRGLVTDRLAACGHHISPIRSVYRWEGVIHDEQEARVALHTRRSLVPRIVERADAEHPYDVPCVIALPIVDGNPGYARWVLAETLDV
jgi:periplasmic divalent cation tolerance protein